MIRRIVCFALVVACLASCGGNPDALPDTPTPRIDCDAHPELCR